MGDSFRVNVEVDEAFDYILAFAPRAEGKNLEQSRWVKKQIKDPESPVCLAQFTMGDMQMALKKIRDMELQADVVSDYPFFVSDLEEWYVNAVLEPMYPSLQEKGILMLGMAGVGKTPALHIIMSAVSR